MIASPQEGTASNRYVVVGKLAGGGMADIFLARSTSEAGIERYVVLKRVLAERSLDPHFAALFLDEARLAAQLQHPNIAQVLDVGKLAGAYFFTMEYVHGEDVRHLLQRSVSLRREIPVQHALAIATGVLAGLHHAHTRTSPTGAPLGIVHRDVSPSNIMVSYEGGVKLLDFGVAKATERSTESSSGTVKGKVAYASPEQCHSGHVDRRSDLYSAGIVLWEMLIGRRLYKFDSDYATMLAICDQTVRAPSELRPAITPALDALVLTALAKDPAARFQTAAAMIEAIEELAAREHHVLSATGLGKLVHELFGWRPEPWFELASRPADQITRQVTVTGEAVAALDAPGAIVIAPSGAHPQIDHALAAQLEHAPELGRRPNEPSTSSTIPPAYSGSSEAPAYVAPRSRRLIAIVVSAVVAAVVIAMIATMATRPSQHNAVSPPPRHAIDARVRDDAPVPDAPVDAIVPAVVPVAVPVDAEIVPVDAPPSRPPPHRKPKNPCDDQRYRDENPLKCQ